MTTILLALFQDGEAARQAENGLKRQGSHADDIQTFHRTSGEAGRDEAGMRRALADLGVEQQEVDAFAAAVAKGAAVLRLTVPDDRSGEVTRLLQESGARGIDRHQQHEETQTLREVEEEVKIGTERVLTGGVQARTKVTEQPVEKTLSLQEERVNVNRKSADRPLSPEEANAAFEERRVELTETAEQAKVSKAAHLIGEVEIAKTTATRQETVKDTARRTEVEVEPVQTADKGRGGTR